MDILILGAGEIGRALAYILKEKRDISVALWDKNADRVPDQRPLAELVPASNVIFVCVPAVAIRNAVISINDMLADDAVIVTLTKGIERETCKTTDKLLEEMAPNVHYAILSGPMLAEELLQGTPGAAVVGTRDTKTYQRIADVFAGTTLAVTHYKDPQSVALCGVLKNIYALALGMIEAAGDGANMRGMFFTKAIDEMARILRHLGAAPDVAWSVAGIGDLIATATSPYSRNRVVGEEFAKGKTQRMESEGLRALPCIPSMLGTHLEEFPLLHALHRIVQDDGSVDELVRATKA